MGQGLGLDECLAVAWLVRFRARRCGWLREAVEAGLEVGLAWLFSVEIPVTDETIEWPVMLSDDLRLHLAYTSHHKGNLHLQS